MSILRTHNLQNPDSSSINIVMDQGGNTNITGVTTVGSNFHVTGGSVGIGTDNPLQLLDVYDSTDNSGSKNDVQGDTGGITIQNQSHVADAFAALRLNFHDEDCYYMKAIRAGNNNGSFEIGQNYSSTSIDSPALTISNNLNIGIGTDNPSDKLHVYGSNGNTVSTIDSVGNDAALHLRNSGNGNWSGINFIRERSTGTNVTGGSIWMPSDTANNSATLYIQTQSASANAGAAGALTDNNGVRLKLASQPNGSGPNSAFTVEVGSTEKFRVSAGGIVTTPNQPAFNAKGFPSHRYMNVWNNVDLDDWNYVNQNGSHFNNSTGRFTAPVAGKYFFIFTSMYTNPTTGDFHNYLYKNGNSFVLSNNHSGGGSGNGHTWNDCTIQAVIPLAANDYVTARCTGSSSAQLYLYGGSATSVYNCFSGFLIG